MNDLLSQKLSDKAPKLWFVTELLGNLIFFVILGVLFFLDTYFSWVYWIEWILMGITVLAVLATIWGMIQPKYLYRSWGYQVDEEFLQTKRGIWKEHWVTIPMSKIQSVTVSQGPFLRYYGLRTIHVETMGSSHNIPALDEQLALDVRDDIAKFAKIKEVDQS
ncbi:hypothetical protein J416_12754 [Gracilibacillus halophilus YIM-C55.5]|uniref:YdbS-like PH domain-containing protein n=1 Tax=Gracilibacillus halophilus YIM-C55.5 TaxID=1308866 RepID=N4WA01_9BACI|nr:PH domain-containing protein [Gracilibacillus halophilus]ENH96074.1 hypothetical protein J416_12754 [Gracilibacillus halophilus YIM-C55.5]